MPYRLKAGYKGSRVKLCSPRYSGLYEDAPQEELEIQFKMGNNRIEQYEEKKEQKKGRPKAAEEDADTSPANTETGEEQ